MASLSEQELRFVKSNEVCRLATASRDGDPHVTPVIYALDGDAFVIVIDYGERKLQNLQENPKVSLVIDQYHPNRAVMVRGTCKILEKGPEYRRLQKILFDTFETYRTNPWEEGQSPILRIKAKKVVSWGLGK